MSTETSMEDPRDQVRKVLEVYLDPSRRQVLSELVNMSEEQQRTLIGSMCLGTRLAFEMAGLIRQKDTGKDFYEVTLLPPFQIALDILKEPGGFSR